MTEPTADDSGTVRDGRALDDALARIAPLDAAAMAAAATHLDRLTKPHHPAFHIKRG